MYQPSQKYCNFTILIKAPGYQSEYNGNVPVVAYNWGSPPIGILGLEVKSQRHPCEINR